MAVLAAVLPASFFTNAGNTRPAAAADNVVDCGAVPHPKCNIVMIVTDDQTLGTLADLADPVNKPAFEPWVPNRPIRRAVPPAVVKATLADTI